MASNNSRRSAASGESTGTGGDVERRVVLDEQGGLRLITAKLGCAEAVLARQGPISMHMIMPARAVLDEKLAQLNGLYGGPLRIAYDATERDLLESGFRVGKDAFDDFLKCSERSNGSSRICRTPACPWFVESEEYGPEECPMDHWKPFEA